MPCRGLAARAGGALSQRAVARAQRRPHHWARTALPHVMDPSIQYACFRERPTPAPLMPLICGSTREGGWRGWAWVTRARGGERAPDPTPHGPTRQVGRRAGGQAAHLAAAGVAVEDDGGEDDDIPRPQVTGHVAAAAEHQMVWIRAARLGAGAGPRVLGGQGARAALDQLGAHAGDAVAAGLTLLAPLARRAGGARLSRQAVLPCGEGACEGDMVGEVPDVCCACGDAVVHAGWLRRCPPSPAHAQPPAPLTWGSNLSRGALLASRARQAIGALQAWRPLPSSLARRAWGSVRSRLALLSLRARRAGRAGLANASHSAACRT